MSNNPLQSPQLKKLRLRDAFELHRTGDAVTGHNVHTVMYDALHLCIAL